MQWGTHKGCPLSTFLLALVLEPLAILVRSSQLVEGLQVGPGEEKILLFADDAFLYLNDANSSLWAALAFFDEVFGRPNQLAEVCSFPS